MGIEEKEIDLFLNEQLISEEIENKEYDEDADAVAYSLNENKFINCENDDNIFVPDGFTCFSKELKKKYVILPKAEQDVIIREIKNGDLSRRDELLCSNMPLVISRARKYHSIANPIWEINDLIQEGYLGLDRALELYDPNKDDKSSFTTYALYWIDNKITRFIQANNGPVRIPIHAMVKYSQTNRLVAKGRSLKEALEIAEISEESYYTIKNILTAISLNKIIVKDGDESDEIGSFVKDNSIPIDFGCVDADTMEEVVKLFKNRLKPKEFDVIVRRIGINGVPAETLESIASSLGVTRERIRQIQKKAIEKTKRGIEKIYA